MTRYGFLIVVLLAWNTASSQDLRNQFFDSNGVRIRYVEAGSGAPVVLLHG